MGSCLYLLDRRHRLIVRRNLQFVFSSMPSQAVRRLSIAVFQHVAITALEVLQVSSFERKDLFQRVRLQGEQHLQQLARSSKGGIFISAHLGNWEIGHIYASCYLQPPLFLVAKDVRPASLNSMVNAIRTRFGSTIISKKRALAPMRRVLKDGGLLGLLIDQGVSRTEGVDISFFGHRVSATPVVALLARRYDCPVVPGFCLRESDGQLTLIIKPPLDLQKTADFHYDIKVNTQKMYDVIEEAIRAYPDQWFWFHKRWKRYHAFLYPEEMARYERRRKRKKASRKKRKRSKSL
ncbi:MAG: lysophospholipid acyltransferase family protein [Deltaproteobacteria bacterium]|nr:lysophospholipid acyltransferase family protein [Deltaproteobacteria bacterium]